MRIELTHLFLLIPPVILLEGFFSGSEIALLSADRLKLKAASRKRSHRATLALELVTHPERILSSTLLMTNLSVIFVSSLVALFCQARFGGWADLYAVAITSPIVLLCGELIPKTLFQRFADRVAPWVAYPVWWTYWAAYPATRVLSAYTAKLSRMLGPVEELITGRRRTTRDEIRALLSYGKRESEIKSSERRMIKRIFDFKDTEAKKALIPLVKVEAIEESATVTEALGRFEIHRHSRMPVYSERIDNIVGLLLVGDLLSASDPEHSIRPWVKPARYVAETQILEDVLYDMRREDNELVVIVDEYGGAVGILTFEDIVEEIVGEIADEYDAEVPPLKELGEGRWLVQARMGITQLNEGLGLDVPKGDYETLGGFLLQQFGRIPETSDELHFNTPQGPIRFTIRKATHRHIETVLIEKMPAPSTS